MFGSKTLASVASLAATSNALYYHLSPFTATDIRVPSESHHISFTISNPDAVFEQGGSAERNCTISWDGCDAPNCWTSCSDAGYPYWARVTPESYKGANDFSVDIWQYYIYRNSAQNNATIPIKEGSDSYWCSRGGQSTICSFSNGYIDSDLDTVYGPIAAQPEDVCAA